MDSSYIVIGAVVVVGAALVYFMMPKKKKFTPTGGRWEGKPNGKHKVILEGLPETHSPYWHPIQNKADLKKKPIRKPAGDEEKPVTEIISIVADIHLYKNVGGKDEIDDDVILATPMTLKMYYTDDDHKALTIFGEKFKQALSVERNLHPMKFDPSAGEWIKFSNADVNHKERVATITIDSWGDPPIGWGIP